jgi:hypothetical protein
MSERTDKLKKVITCLSHSELEIVKSYILGAMQVSQRVTKQKRKPRPKIGNRG